MNKPLLHQSLRNQLLIAMPGMVDGRFANTVTYICEHTREGAMGLVINQPIDTDLDDLLEQMGLELSPLRRHYGVLCGGPVQQERGFVLHRRGKQWSHTVDLGDDLALTASRDVLESMAVAEGPDDALVLLGYAGWEAGQLERELADNAWLTVPATPAILFDVPFEQRVRVAAFQLGFDFNLLSAQAGHA
ncbi:MAG TPA: YqgE/AlgH family protein [Pseudomonadales bacterium]|nr:YqgE/AlgH family protein [Pseudomonadales bacterium]